jgi:hypothetical protein
MLGLSLLVAPVGLSGLTVFWFGHIFALGVIGGVPLAHRSGIDRGEVEPRVARRHGRGSAGIAGTGLPSASLLWILPIRQSSAYVRGFREKVWPITWNIVSNLSFGRSRTFRIIRV